MPILGPDGGPVNGRAPAQSAQLLGFMVLRQDPNVLEPLRNDQGAVVFFPDAQAAINVARQMADAELRPSADQKIVIPMMQSKKYFVAQCVIIGQLQANMKNPEQLLAENPAKVN